MKKILEVIERGEGHLHKGDDNYLSSAKRNMKFTTGGGTYKVLSVEKTKNHRRILVTKIKDKIKNG